MFYRLLIGTSGLQLVDEVMQLPREIEDATAVCDNDVLYVALQERVGSGYKLGMMHTSWAGTGKKVVPDVPPKNGPHCEVAAYDTAARRWIALNMRPLAFLKFLVWRPDGAVAHSICLHWAERSHRTTRNEARMPIPS